MSRRWCPGCGHFHGEERCTAVTHDAEEHTRRCGCTNHQDHDS